MKRRHFLGYLFFSLAGCTTVTSHGDRAPDNSTVNRFQNLRFAVSDVKGIDELQRDYETFRIALEEVLEKKIEFFPVDNYVQAAVALQLDRVDLVLAGPSEYVIIKARTNAIPIIAITRPDYYSIVVVRRESDIESVPQLKGRKIAMWSEGSTSGHLGPLKLLIDANLDIRSEADIELKMLADEGIQALIDGKVDAWSGGVIRYQRLLEYRGINDKDLRVIAQGSPLPKDVFIANSQLNWEAVEQMRSRMLQEQETLLQSLLKVEAHKKYARSRLVKAEDSEYDTIREVYRAIGQDSFL